MKHDGEATWSIRDMSSLVRVGNEDSTFSISRTLKLGRLTRSQHARAKGFGKVSNSFRNCENQSSATALRLETNLVMNLHRSGCAVDAIDGAFLNEVLRKGRSERNFMLKGVAGR